MNTQELEVIATILEDTHTTMTDNERMKAAELLRRAARKVAALEFALIEVYDTAHSGCYSARDNEAAVSFFQQIGRISSNARVKQEAPADDD
jgi:hypothetical protein